MICVYGQSLGVYCEKNSVLTIQKANRKEDTGQYKIRLSCMGGGGEATGACRVIIQLRNAAK